jgi:phage terminase large subunit-like protein
MNYIREYWAKIQAGEIVACKRLLQQYTKIIDELDNPREPWVFDLQKANRPIDFIESFCKHSKGKWIGKPVKLELFQKAKIQAVYGFVHKDTGMRRCREVFTLVARKNGKSTEKAATGNYMFIGDGEGGAEVFSVATKKDQARIVFSEAVNMVAQSPDLSEHVKKRKTDLYFPVTFSKFEPLASDSNSLDGLNVHNGIMDELHAIKDRNLYDVIKQAMSAREQPLLDMITTAGFVRECIFDSIYDYACNVLDGLIEDERFLAFIYELDDREEWTDYRCWEKANPGLGTIKSYQELAANVERAKNDPDFLPTVLTKDFNVRETTAGAWLTFEQANNPAEYDMEYLRDSYAVSGTDLSATVDLSCATLLVMKPNDPTKYAIQMYFLPEDLVEVREKEDRIPYRRWAERGLLTLCPGNKVDYSMVTAWYVKMVEQYGIRPLWNYYDPWGSIYWIDEMKSKGFNMVICRPGPQTLSQPMKEMGADLGAKLINYNNNPVAKWCLTNTAVKRDDNDNIRPIKGKSQRARIDGAVSLLIAYTGLFEQFSNYKALI